MIEIMDIDSGNILAVKARGKLVEEDYHRVLVPEIERAIDRYGKINMLIKIEDFQGWTPGAAWEDFKLTPRIRSINRMAIVGDADWERWVSGILKFLSSFTDAEIRFFREERMDEAVDWVRWSGPGEGGMA